jgi:hypothetical protein
MRDGSATERKRNEKKSKLPHAVAVPGLAVGKP